MRQAQALQVMMSGQNVFLTGAPGAGKTYILERFVKQAMAAGQQVAVTASTGIAASHLGGTTIHAWSGLGILDSLQGDDLERLGNSDRLIKRYNATDILVIDEISMLHGARLDMINRLAKVLRANDRPFGGLQVVLVGDLFQLPPVSRGSRELDFAHLSPAWHELDLQICYITEQHRQQAHDGLLELLEAMRSGDVAEQHGELLQGRIGNPPPADQAVTRLYAHNVDVESINKRQLAAIDSRSRIFKWSTKGSQAKIEQLAKGLLVPPELELKVDAEVMFVANNFAEGFVNGSRGTVYGFKGDNPMVELVNGRRIEVEPHSWSLSEDGRIRAEITQLPLRLAWAITIHKSQGMSLDAAEIDLSRTFTTGMGYVALSRVRSIAGLYLLGINTMALGMHPHMAEFDRDLRSRSAHLANTTEDYQPPAAAPAASGPPAVDDALFESLKRWRLERSRRDGVAPYMIAHNAALMAIAANPPANQHQLLALPGFGAKKVEAYSSDILSILAAYKTKS